MSPVKIFYNVCIHVFHLARINLWIISATLRETYCFSIDEWLFLWSWIHLKTSPAILVMHQIVTGTNSSSKTQALETMHGSWCMEAEIKIQYWPSFAEIFFKNVVPHSYIFPGLGLAPERYTHQLLRNIRYE